MEKRDSEKNIEVNSSKLNSSKSQSNTPLKSVTESTQYGGVNDDILLLESEKSKSKMCSYMRSLTIEPIMFCFSFALILNYSCLTNMIIDKGCLYYLNYTQDICKNLSAYPAEKEASEKLGNNYGLYANLMSLIGAFFMIFIAPWSDKYGRKTPLLLAFIGIALSDMGLVLCCLIFESPLFYIVLTRLPQEIFGGIICVFTIIYSHSSEVSSEKSRTLKYTTLQLAFGSGMSLGGLCGGLIYRYFGYVQVYSTATILHVICLPWIIFALEETTGLDSTATWMDKFKDFFVFESLLKGWKASVRKRENKGRLLLLLYFASMCVVVLTYESFGTINFVYAHNLYNWDAGTYNFVSTIFMVLQIIILVILIPLLMRVFKVSDSILGLLGVVSTMLKFTIIAFANYGVYIYYIASFSGSMSGVLTLAIRTGVSKLVDKDELGRVFSFLAICESIFPIGASILLTKLFNATFEVHPNVTYLMTAGLLILPLLTFIFAQIRGKKAALASNSLH